MRVRAARCDADARLPASHESDTVQAGMFAALRLVRIVPQRIA